jgi:hypothetical protein
MKPADLKKKQFMEDYYRIRNETIKKYARLKPGDQIRNDWEKKFIYSRKIPPENMLDGSKNTKKCPQRG